MKYEEALQCIKSDASKLIKVSCIHHAEQRAQQIQAEQIISLLDSRRKPPIYAELPHAKRLVYFFDDQEDESTPEMERAVAAIVQLGSSWRRDKEFSRTLIHCYGGVSRSTAGAYILLCSGFPDIMPVEHFDTITQKLTYKSVPNLQMIEIADNIMRAQGEILKPAAEYKKVNFSKRAAHIRRQRRGLEHRQHA